MFRRLNQFLTPLKPQELRNATYNGPFVHLAMDLADNEYWAENRIVRPVAIRRMADIEFVSELLIGSLHGPQGGSSAVIDEYYRQYEDYEDEFPSQRRAEKLFNGTLETIQSILPSIKDTRWNNKTDFYSLFVAIAHLLRTSRLPSSRTSRLRRDLLDFAGKVDQRMSDETVKASKDVIDYVRAVEKGVNDKPRRAVRHAILLTIIRPYYKPKPGSE